MVMYVGLDLVLHNCGADVCSVLLTSSWSSWSSLFPPPSLQNCLEATASCYSVKILFLTIIQIFWLFHVYIIQLLLKILLWDVNLDEKYIIAIINCIKKCFNTPSCKYLNETHTICGQHELFIGLIPTEQGNKNFGCLHSNYGFVGL